jgi:putative transposase
MSKEDIPWPHAPTHRLASGGTYFLTVGTYLKAHHFRGPERLKLLHDALLRTADSFRWHLEAWAVFSNHYHFVGHSPGDEDNAKSLPVMLKELHRTMSLRVNDLDDSPGRRVWFNYRETRLTYQRSYLARLSYTHQNAVKHGLVAVANQYPWCSARWFERTATSAQVNSIYRFKIDQVRVFDEFEPDRDWSRVFPTR